MTPMLAADPWVGVLADFVGRLAEQERVVEQAELGQLGDPDAVLALAVFEPPAGLPPMPRDLVDVAERLAARANAVTQRLAALIAADRPTRPARPNWARPRGAAAGATDLDVRA